MADPTRFNRRKAPISPRHDSCNAAALVTPERYWAAMAAFHFVVLTSSWLVAARWADPARCRRPLRSWLSGLCGDMALLAVFVYAASLAAPFAVNLDHPRRLHVGEISLRLLGQALFLEAVFLSLAIALAHRRTAQHLRAGALAVFTCVLFAVYVDAYRVEPGRLVERRHFVDPADGPADSGSVRILHLTDIQTPAIGAHEARALRAGLSYRPDLIVLTGDYVQDALGRPTERKAARELRSLVTRIGFQAPLGVFATEGDVGPPCREVFAGTPVRCLTDESALVALAAGDTLKITGLSRGRGRASDPVLLARLLNRGPQGDHQIVISHAPDFVDSLPQRVDLVLAGHTHGGQVVLPFFGPLVTASRLPRRYAADLHFYKGIPLHVSRGVGMERGFAPPLRFLCPPEICVLDVRLPMRVALARR
jgi:predicted MPP superfamily phosphohydrolase